MHPVKLLDENQAIALVHGTIEASCKWGNIVIIGRGGQGILKDKPGVLHVRIEAPLDIRVKRIQDQENGRRVIVNDSCGFTAQDSL